MVIARKIVDTSGNEHVLGSVHVHLMIQDVTQLVHFTLHTVYMGWECISWAVAEQGVGEKEKSLTWARCWIVLRLTRLVNPRRFGLISLRR